MCGRTVGAIVAVALAASGCSLVRDFSRFEEGAGTIDADLDARLLDASMQDAGATIDADADRLDSGSAPDSQGLDGSADSGAPPVDAVLDAGADASASGCVPGCAGNQRCIAGVCRDIGEARFFRVNGTDASVVQLEADDDGNLYALITHFAPITLNGTTITSGGESSQVVVSLTPDLMVRWHVALPSTTGASARLHTIRASGLGEVHGFGTCRGAITVGSRTGLCQTTGALRILITPSGQVSELNPFPVSTSSVGGIEWGTASFRPGPPAQPVYAGLNTPPPQPRLMFGQLGYGVFHEIPGLTARVAPGLAAGADGRLFALGDLASTVTVGGTLLEVTIDEFYQPLFLRLSSSASPATVERARTWPVKAGFIDVVALPNELVAIGATFDGNQVSLGGFDLTGSFIARLDLDGTIISAADTTATAIELELAGSSLILAFEGVPRLAPPGLIGYGSVVSQRASDGAYEWGWSNNISPSDVVQTRGGRAYVSGRFMGTQRFAGTVVDVVGSDGVIIEIDVP